MTKPNEINIIELDEELLQKIDIIVEQYNYESREHAIKSMLNELASKSVGVITGGADIRNLICVNKKCHTDR